LIVAQEDGDPARQRLHAWDVTTGKETRSWPVALARPARYMLAPDARHVVMRAAEGEMAILEFSSGTERSLPVVTPMTGGVAFSPDGRWLALPSTVGWVKIWSLNRNEGIAELTGFVLGVHSAAFSPDSRRLIAGSSGTEAVRLWETDGFEPLMNLTAEGSLFGSAAFSPRGDVIGARNGAAQLYLWRAPSLAEITAAESRSSRPRK
jgi:WD40 repeat protein